MYCEKVVYWVKCKYMSIILITGASSGIGKQTAEYLSSNGHIVYGASRHPQENHFFSSVSMDITDERSVKKAVGVIIDKEGSIDVLINCAGIGIAGSVEDTTMDEIKSQFETNFFGTVLITKHVLPSMRKIGSGLIVTMSSMSGVIGLPYQSFYSASKFALEGYTEALRLEVESFGIKIVNILPGDFATNFTVNRNFSKKSQQEDSVYLEKFRKTMEVYAKDEKNGSDSILIAKLVNKVVNTPSPKPRYFIGGKLQMFASILKRILPDCLWYKIMRSSYKTM